MADGRYRRLKDEYGQVAVAIRSRYDNTWTLTYKKGIESYSLEYRSFKQLMAMLESKGRGWKVVRKW